MRAISERLVGLPSVSALLRTAYQSLKEHARAASPTLQGRPLAADSSGRFVVVLSQGRAGSTLILRMLNASPSVRICGENNKAFDHLHRFFESFRDATKNHNSDFYKLAWKLPCDQPTMLNRLRDLAINLYNPSGAYQVIGFKEIRYGLDGKLETDLAFLRQLFPKLKVVFNVRRTEDCVKSLWWAADPENSAKMLDTLRVNFWDYYIRNRHRCYWMPFEELRRGSEVLRGMFDFLDIPMTARAEAELDIRLRE
jgi:hypothetical protein